MRTLYFAIVILFTFFSKSYCIQIHHLQEGSIVSINNYEAQFLKVFCYEGKPKYIIHLWQSVILNINHPSNDYTRYDGGTPEEIEQLYNNNKYSWSWNFFSNENKFKLNPFNKSCIGIVSKNPYTVHLSIIKIDLWKLIYLSFGVLLFLSAPKLSQNTLFYYVCGVTLGICTSFLILIYFVSKIFPRKPFMYGVLGCGWTVVLYVLQVLWENLRTILEQYKSYVAWYIFVTGIISFILCYRWGPVENERSRNLIRWSLQLVALASIYFSSHFQEAAMAQIVILLLIHFIPKNWFSLPKRYWKRRFPPKVNLLSNDEYYVQGVQETNKALEELREYCCSPDCNQWKMALKLNNVKRFASFVEGNSHLSDEEILEYETSINGELTDEENEYTEEEYDD